ncbi:hypothetical protein H0H81_001829 [Sphagnurus paluster]|uniref:ABM domain-containing protein n=1 Tax=Sphagnurus paluster TaxID=117069 RepID=A0A9P7GH11_9AGAR|nr:hypothetical protein H0H81_001829 [Sphagnurus paluster]
MAPAVFEIIRVSLNLQPPATWLNDLTKSSMRDPSRDHVYRAYGFLYKRTGEFVWVNAYKSASDYVSLDSPTRAEFASILREYSSSVPGVSAFELADGLPDDKVIYAPFHELSDLPFKKNLTIQEITDLLNPKFGLENEVRGIVGAAWSFDVKNDHKVVIFSSWKSIEDYEDAITNHKEIFREIVKNIRENLETPYEVYATELTWVA